MLVLSRKVSEKITIGPLNIAGHSEPVYIEIEVRKVAGNRATLAIDAPRDLRILRGELVEKLRE